MSRFAQFKRRLKKLRRKHDATVPTSSYLGEETSNVEELVHVDGVLPDDTHHTSETTPLYGTLIDSAHQNSQWEGPQGSIHIKYSAVLPGDGDGQDLITVVSSSRCDICSCAILCVPARARALPLGKVALQSEFPPRSREPWISDIEESSQKGCHSCQVLYRGLKAVFPWLGEKSMENYEVGLDIGPYGMYQQPLVYRFQDRRTREQYHVEFFTPEGDKGDKGALWIGAFTPGRDLLKSRRENYAPLLKSWIESCDQNHTSSGCESSAKPIPARVIDVGSANKEPVLYFSRGEVAQYVALSHCWGIDPFIRTTRSNIDALRRQISFESLPQNFQDAITITRELGLQYLWIDALCIIQDDSLDWEHQSGEMCNVYNNAYVVLAATRARNCYGGMLTQSNEAVGVSIRVASVQDDAGSVSHIHARRHYKHQNPCDMAAGYPAQQSPLAQRAWAFQEQLLAKRTIHFTDTELIWECEQRIRCECMELDVCTENGRWTFNKSLKSKIHTLQFEGWREIVKSYTRRALTYETDRLPALSGLVKLMQAEGAGRYVAGLWFDDLPQGLLWTTPAYCHRAVPYRAPTWSWASLNAVNGSQSYIMPFLPRGAKLNVTRLSIKSVKCEPVGDDATGAVKSGKILLSAPILEARADRPKIGTGGYCRSEDAFIVINSEKAYVKWDVELSLTKNNVIYVLLLGDALIGRHMSYQGLIIQESTATRGAYERVGILSHNRGGNRLSTIFRDAPSKDIMIV